MGYYMRSVYRGDYYGQGRGDYYRPRVGDPGFFDFISDVGSAIGGVVGGIGRTVAPFLPGPIGTIVGGVSRLLSPGTPIANPPQQLLAPPPIWAATAPGTGSTAAMMPSSPFGPGGRPPNLLAPMPGGSSAFTGLSVGGPSGLRIGSGSTPGGGTTTQVVQDVHTGRYHVALCPARGGATPTRTAFRRVDSWEVKCHKRMNPLNPHALRKALRRAHGFTRLVSKTLRFTKPGHKVGGFKKMGGKKKK